MSLRVSTCYQSEATSNKPQNSTQVQPCQKSTMSVSRAIDTSGVAVITGGASGFGFETAERLLRAGMAVAVLDISAKELTQAEKTLGAIAGANQVAAIKCDVSKFDECMQAQQAVQAAFGSKPVSLLFNNAGIQGAHSGSMILAGEPEAWAPIFSVNVFGAVHIVKAFLPPMIEAGPLASGKQSLLVTTRYLRKKVQFSLGNQFSSNVKYLKFGSSFGSVRMQMLRKHVLLCNPPTRSDCHQGQPGVIPRHLLGRV